jgi:outer membrane protein assembly factor BamA
MDYSYVRIYETVLRRIAGNFYAGAGYIFDDHWNIEDNGSYGHYAAYGAVSPAIASGITINGVLDTRDNAINPFKGSYASLQYRDNYDFLGSTNSWRSLIIDLRTYINFPSGSENVLALWNYEWLTLNGKPDYLELPSTQWDAYSATGRGYIQGRFRGAQMIYGEAEYRFRILRNGLLGGVFFLNAETLSAAPGSPLQGIQPGLGPGLRIKLNKVSRTNISVDYGFGRQGSNGLFIDVGEIF